MKGDAEVGRNHRVEAVESQRLSEVADGEVELLQTKINVTEPKPIFGVVEETVRMVSFEHESTEKAQKNRRGGETKQEKEKKEKEKQSCRRSCVSFLFCVLFLSACPASIPGRVASRVIRQSLSERANGAVVVAHQLEFVADVGVAGRVRVVELNSPVEELQRRLAIPLPEREKAKQNTRQVRR